MITPSWFLKPDSQLTDAQREQKQNILKSEREADRRLNPTKYLFEDLKQKSQSSQMIGGPGSTWNYAPGSQIIGGPDAVLKRSQGWLFGTWWQGSQSRDATSRIPKELLDKTRKGPGATTPEKYLTQSGGTDKRKQYADMYAKHDGSRYAARPQSQPIFGKDPITWNPQKSSQTGKITTRKSMGLGAILNTLKFVVPYAWEAGKYVGDILVNSLFQGGYGDGVSDQWIAKGAKDMDGTPSTEEMKGEEILVATQSEMSRRQIVAAMAEQSHIEASVLNTPIIGLKHSQVTISLHLEYIF